MKKGFLFVLLFFFFLLILILAISQFAITSRTSFFGKATSGALDEDVSVENSYLFASPLQALAGNQEKVRVTIFILSSKGLGVNGKKVSLGTDPGISINEVQGITDSYGKAMFNISATNPGEYLIEAVVGSSKLPQTVRVSFR